jgi:hypothetical protein
VRDLDTGLVEDEKPRSGQPFEDDGNIGVRVVDFCARQAAFRVLGAFAELDQSLEHLPRLHLLLGVQRRAGGFCGVRDRPS